MGKILSVLIKPVKNYNIEARAQKVLQKEKPTPAPKYPTTDEMMSETLRQNPNILEEQSLKNEELHEHLKKVYITSTDPEVQPESPSPLESTKQLPQNRKAVVEDMFGYFEPKVIPRGRFSLREGLQFITNHQQEPEKWTAAYVANAHGLNEKLTENVLHYFRTFELYLPKDKKEGELFDAVPTETIVKLEAKKSISEPTSLITDEKAKQ